MKEKTYDVRIYTKWDTHNKKAKYFLNLGMSEKSTYRGNYYYEISNVTEEGLADLRKAFWKIKTFHMSSFDGLCLKSCEMRWTRNATYRKRLINADRKNGRKKRCVYCGKIHDVSEMQVDHIIPINGLMNTVRARNIASFFGIHEANDLKNLCFACKRCNQKKGANVRFYWIIKAFLGKHKLFWKVRSILNIMIAAAVGYLFYCVYQSHIVLPGFSVFP